MASARVPALLAKDADGKTLVDETWPAEEVSGVPAALDKVVEFLREQIGGKLPFGVGHRVVHGGPDYSAPTVVSDAVSTASSASSARAAASAQQPRPDPRDLSSGNRACCRSPASIPPSIAAIPSVADRFAIPEELYGEGVRRYGFHGLSYEYIAERLRDVAPDIAKGRVVVAHLGSGASMCALVGGSSVESTMGFTALDGLPMGTRPGQLDAGVVLYLMSEKGMSAEAIERFLYNECGLKGLSGISNDVRELLASSDPRAKLALDYFVYRIALLYGNARGGHGRHRRLRVHGWHRGERAGHSRGGRAAPRMARPRARSPQPTPRASR